MAARSCVFGFGTKPNLPLHELPHRVKLWQDSPPPRQNETFENCPLIRFLLMFDRFQAGYAHLAILLAGALLALHAPVFAAGGDGSGPTTPPNVVIIMADDLGYGDIGAFGSQVIATPRIDDLCASGMRLDSFYAHPTCSPSRAAMLTGRYSQRVGVTGPIGSWATKGLSTDEVTLAEVLKTVGYRTAVYGKWHIGDAPEQQPTAQGFDEFRGLLWGPTGIPLVLADSTRGVLEYEPDLTINTIDVTAKTLDFIDRSVTAMEPFLCFASYIAPHEPATASPGFQGISADGRDYGDSVEELDASVGTIVDHLTSLNLLDDTIIIFLSDNGATHDRIPYQDGSNLPFSFGKGTTWEGGVRVPACISWPGHVPMGAVQPAPLFIGDLMPTIALWAGATLDPTITLDGLDVRDVFEGGTPDPLRIVHLSDKSDFDAVRQGRFKYRRGELYDLELDPEELVDVSSAFAIETAQLALELDAIKASVLADSRPAADSSRLTARFRGEFSLPDPPVDGSVWSSKSSDPLILTLVDSDPALDAQIVDSSGLGTFSTPQRAVELVDYTDAIRFEGVVPDIAPGAPFTVGVWYKLPDVGLTEEIVLVDIGDDEAGLSFTLGDAGILGDDLAPGRLDDLLVRVGGSLSLDSSSVAVDLPDLTAVEFLHLAAVFTEGGELLVYVNGLEAGRVLAAGVDPGTDRTWAFLSAHGTVGGSAGPGVLPFATSRSIGELAAVSVIDREMRPNEMSSEYARFALMIYCQGRPNSTGNPANFKLDGIFRRADNRLFIEVDSLPPTTVGFMLGSETQLRTNVAQGALCIAGDIRRFSNQIFVADGAGRIDDHLDLDVAPIQVLDPFVATWNFQFWYRDGFDSNFSNGIHLTFGN